MNRYTGYTGRSFETEILWRCRWKGWNSYMPYRKSMAIVKKSQPWDPTDPSSPAANDLHALIAEALGIEDYSALKLYTAVGSPLDRFHGIDGFAEWNNVIVTFDLTTNGQKNSHKADIILHEEDVYTEEGRVNRVRLGEVASEVAQLLRWRMAV